MIRKGEENGWEGGQCTRCGLSLDDGYCPNDRCPFAHDYQDELAGIWKYPSRAEEKYINNLILEGMRVELLPHLKLWIRGAKFGEVVLINHTLGFAKVRMDDPAVKRIQKIKIADLKKV
jgi:hypothetical protein